MRNRTQSRARVGAFTLIELLLVISIIVLLIGIVLPAANLIRVAAKRAQTLSTINRISTACEAYYQDFSSYPGTFGNNWVQPAVALSNTAPAATIAFPSHTPAVVNATTITSTENLLLSLLGGLSATTTTPMDGVYNFDLKTMGKGAASLNPARPGKSAAYLELQPDELSTNVANVQFLPNVPTDPPLPVGQYMGPPRVPPYVVTPEPARPVDSPLPEILDSFSRPQPILYMRAARGNSGFISTQAAPLASAQYDIRQLAAYAFPQADTDAPDLQNHPNRTFAYYNPTKGTLTAGAAAYFGNPDLSGSGNVVVHKDQYILISAGPDGFFGTDDDIRN